MRTLPDSPRVTPAQTAANEWLHKNWHEGLEIAGSDSAYGSFHSFMAGVEWAQAQQPTCPVERGEIGVIHASVADLKRNPVSQ